MRRITLSLPCYAHQLISSLLSCDINYTTLGVAYNVARHRPYVVDECQL